MRQRPAHVNRARRLDLGSTPALSKIEFSFAQMPVIARGARRTGRIGPVAIIPKVGSEYSERFPDDVHRTWYSSKDGTYSEWLCAAVGAARLDQDARQAKW